MERKVKLFLVTALLFLTKVSLPSVDNYDNFDAKLMTQGDT